MALALGTQSALDSFSHSYSDWFLCTTSKYYLYFKECLMDYRDKTIHAFLSSISEETPYKSNTTNSIYYKIQNSEFRFSDHYSEKSHSFNLIKTSNGLYVFQHKELRISSAYYASDILSFLKSYFLVLPLFVQNVKQLQDVAAKAVASEKKVRASVKLVDLELAEMIEKENQQLKQENKALQAEMNKVANKAKQTVATCRSVIQKDLEALKRLGQSVDMQKNSLKQVLGKLQ